MASSPTALTSSREDIDLMNDYKARIIDGSLEVPASL
jgi:hypothetical protein